MLCLDFYFSSLECDTYPCNADDTTTENVIYNSSRLPSDVISKLLQVYHC
jgi:hypothetical protein